MRQSRYTALLPLPFAVFLIVLFLRGAHAPTRDLTIVRVETFVQFHSSNGEDVLLPVAKEDKGAGLMYGEQKDRFASVPALDASAVMHSPAIQFMAGVWEFTGLIVPGVDWLLLSLSTVGATPYDLIRHMTLLATQHDQGLSVIIDADYECRVGSPAFQ